MRIQDVRATAAVSEITSAYAYKMRCPQASAFPRQPFELYSGCRGHVILKRPRRLDGKTVPALRRYKGIIRLKSVLARKLCLCSLIVQPPACAGSHLGAIRLWHHPSHYALVAKTLEDRAIASNGQVRTGSLPPGCCLPNRG